MLALVLSTALLAAGSSPTASLTAATGQSGATTQFLEKYDNGLLRPVRARRPVTIGIASGVNGLGGSGLLVGYNVTPHWSLDASGGFGMAYASGYGHYDYAFNGRAGVRGRYNFLTSYWTPFVSLGASYLFIQDSMSSTYRSSSVANSDVRLGDPSNAEGSTVSYKVQSAPSASATLGMSYQGPRGLSFMAGLGWSQLLDRKSNIVVTDGTMTAEKRRSLDLSNGSGPVADLMIGYSF